MKRWLTYAPYALMAFIIMAPLLMPGYVFALDMFFVPRLRMPDTVTNDYLWLSLLHLINAVVPSQIIEKSILFAIPLLTSIGMHRLLRLWFGRGLSAWSVYVGSVFYVVNPFVYERFMAGQYAILLGYVLLPWFVRELVVLARKPNYRSATKMSLLGVVVGIVSLHTLASLMLLGVIACVFGLWHYRHKPLRLGLYMWPVLAGAFLFLLLSCYWVVPVLLGKGRLADAAGRTGTADFSAFAVTGGDIVIKVTNMLRLQGFWVEGRNLFTLPQDRTPLWGLVVMVMLLLVGYGLWCLWRDRRTVAAYLLTVMFAVMVLAAGVLAWLGQHTSLLGGLREPHKLVGLIALGYAISLAYGVEALRSKFVKKYDWLPVAVALLLIVLFTWPMMWGFAGQLRPRQYPPEWYAANQRLNQDKDDFAVLFLPWHQYMSFDFSELIIANPAPQFFDKPIVSSDDPEIGNIAPTSTNQTVRQVDELLKAPPQPQLAGKLAKYRIKYIIVARGHDHAKYDYLRSQPGLELIHDTPSLLLYRNHARN